MLREDNNLSIDSSQHTGSTDLIVSACFFVCDTFPLFLDVNECESIPCQNSGTCRDELNRYLCKCTNGYAGANCQASMFNVNMQQKIGLNWRS